jgi:hypothetical protein
MAKRSLVRLGQVRLGNIILLIYKLSLLNSTRFNLSTTVVVSTTYLRRWHYIPSSLALHTFVFGTTYLRLWHYIPSSLALLTFVFGNAKCRHWQCKVSSLAMQSVLFGFGWGSWHYMVSALALPPKVSSLALHVSSLLLAPIKHYLSSVNISIFKAYFCIIFVAFPQ